MFHTNKYLEQLCGLPLHKICKLSSSCVVAFVLACSAEVEAQLAWQEKYTAIECKPEAQEVRWDFTFRNIGNYAVKVTGVRSSCGCTSATAEPGELAPGSTGVVRTIIQPKARSGPQIVVVNITTDDPSGSSVQLSMRLNVRPVLMPNHRFLAWERNGVRAPKILELTDSGYGAKVVRIDSGDARVSVTQMEGGASGSVKLAVSVADVSQPMRTILKITTDQPSSRPQTIEIPVQVVDRTW